MSLYELTSDDMSAIEKTTYAALGLFERQDLQRILRDCLHRVVPGTLVLDEEFSQWESARRMDLLALDADRRLIVVELKRQDGGHMELQALRYAAMVSTLTFEQAITVHMEYRRKRGEILSASDAEAAIREHLDDPEGSITFDASVRILLIAESFNAEITSAALYMNSQGLDITCVRMTPYKLGERILVDVEQLIPLKEAQTYQVAIRVKQLATAAAAAAAKTHSKFWMQTPSMRLDDLPKRHLIRELAAECVRRGLAPSSLAQSVSWRRNDLFLSAAGTRTGAQVLAEHPQKRVGDYFHKEQELLFADGRTWLVNNQWGHRTEEAAGILSELCGPDVTFGTMARVNVESSAA